MNLLCVEGLPGYAQVDIAQTQTRLDELAAIVKRETDRHWYRLTDPRYAAHYRHSETHFRIELLLQTLQEQCGVKYNRARIDNPIFSDPKDQFLHGVLDPSHGGTCASMPLVYVAVGRRLGYPLKLVMTRGHLFFRWDDGVHPYTNFDGSGEGIGSDPDEYYRHWPYELTTSDLASREYLVSLSPVEELAIFLAARGHCLMDLHRFEDAAEAYQQMAVLAPTFKNHGQFVAAAQAATTTGSSQQAMLMNRNQDRFQKVAFLMPDDPEYSVIMSRSKRAAHRHIAPMPKPTMTDIGVPMPTTLQPWIEPSVRRPVTERPFDAWFERSP